MITTLLVGLIIILVAINIFLWRSGSLQTAEKPEPVLDVPMMDPKEQKAIKKRLRRWQDQSRLTRDEFETFWRLCEEEWNEPK